ncbi:hypothetical protein KR044_009433, partial [Drosophila immigrans]
AAADDADAADAAADVAADVDGCAANDICVVEMLQPKDTASNKCGNSNNSSRTARRRCSVGGKCIWPASDWMRRLRHKESQLQQPHPEQLRRDVERRSSVLLMVLLSSSAGSEMEAKAVVVSEQQPQPQHQPHPRLTRTATEDLDDAIDALWL